MDAPRKSSWEKTALKGTLVIIGLAVFLFSALYVSAFLPREPIVKHIRQDSAYILSRGQHPTQRVLGFSSTLDGLTDAYMMSEAIPRPTQYTPLRQTILSPTLKIPSPGTEVATLYYQVNGKQTGAVEYSRYWHGYLVTLRPLLTLFSYRTAIAINAVLFFLLALTTLYMFYRSGGWFCAGALLVALLAVGILAVPFCFQTSTMFYIAFIGVILAALLNRRYEFEKFDWLLFVVLGMLTSFFDFLTIPLLSLVLPLLYIVITSLPNKKPAYLWKRVLLVAVCWAGGYIGFWAVKWLLVVLMQGPSAWQSIWATILSRSSASEVPQSRLAAIAINIGNFPLIDRLSGINRLVVALGGEMLLVALTGLFFWRKWTTKQRWFRASLFLFASQAPFIWYLLIANHSMLNALFTYRLLLVTIFASLLYLEYLLKPTIQEPLLAEGVS